LEFATRAFVRHDFHSDRGPAFNGTLRAASLPGLGVATVVCDPCRIERNGRHIAQDNSDELVVCPQLRGRMLVAQDGRDGCNEEGSFLLLDMRRPYTQVIEGDTQAIVAKIPRLALETRLGSVAALTSRTMSPDNPVAALASSFLSALVTRIDGLDDLTAGKLAEQTLDLLALAFSVEMQKGTPTLSSARAMTLLRLKSVIERRLHDPDLKPATAASETGMSIRYANALLLTEGTSLERYIIRRRLERTRGLLEDPGHGHKAIGEIAFACGFSDLSHFARRFKAEFGVSPSEYRRQETFRFAPVSG
jgi:AraC-like DNA-binding protein